MADAIDHAAEIKAHEATYSGFIAFAKWGTVAAALVAALVVFLIAS